jgi:hypothetical protein
MSWPYLLFGIVHHGYAGIRYDLYSDDLERGYNKWRWADATISMPFIVAQVAFLVGIRDLAPLLFIGLTQLAIGVICGAHDELHKLDTPVTSSNIPTIQGRPVAPSVNKHKYEWHMWHSMSFGNVIGLALFIWAVILAQVYYDYKQSVNPRMYQVAMVVIAAAFHIILLINQCTSIKRIGQSVYPTVADFMWTGSMVVLRLVLTALLLVGVLTISVNTDAISQWASC